MRAHISSVGSIIAAALLLGAAPAHALQPLADFLTAARTASLDNREAAATAVEQRQEALIALGRELPSLSVRGSYTRNQFQAIFPVMLAPNTPTETLTIQPYDQWDLFVEADAPLVDFAGWARSRAAYRAGSAARHNARATALEVQKQVARLYYTLVGDEALRQSVERTLAAALSNANLTRERRAAGIATELDVARAQAEVERAHQSIADVELQDQLARHSLLVLSGVTPSGAATATEDDLHDETPLVEWDKKSAEVPSLAAAAELTRSAVTNARAAKLSLAPTLTASFVERITNATSFIGVPEYYTFSLNLAWRLDVAAVATLRAQATQAELASIREERSKLAVHTQIFEAWQRVQNGIVKSRSARAQAKASALAAQFATERYASGTGTQLELVQAQRDAFAADVARVQADADLLYSRALLRLSSGVSLEKDRPE